MWDQVGLVLVLVLAELTRCSCMAVEVEAEASATKTSQAEVTNTVPGLHRHHVALELLIALVPSVLALACSFTTG